MSIKQQRHFTKQLHQECGSFLMKPFRETSNLLLCLSVCLFVTVYLSHDQSGFVCCVIFCFILFYFLFCIYISHVFCLAYPLSWFLCSVFMLFAFYRHIHFSSFLSFFFFGGGGCPLLKEGETSWKSRYYHNSTCLCVSVCLSGNVS